MTVAERIRQLFGGRTQPQDNKLLQTLYKYIGQNTPLTIDQDSRSYIRNAYNTNSLVYSIISWLAQKAATVPIKVYDYDGELVEQHPLYDLLKRPNYLQGKSEFFQQYYGFKLITGNTFMYSPRIETGANKGKAPELWIMPAQYTEIVSNGYWDPVSEYRLTIGDVTQRFQAQDVLHDKYPNYEYEYGEELYGMSPIKAAARVIAKSNDSQIASQKAFQNNGAIGIISSDGDPMGEDFFTEEQAQQLRRGWDKKYSGANNQNKIAFISSKIKYTNLGISPVDLQLIEDMNWTLQDLCRVYHVPSVLFNDTAGSTYNNMRTARKIAFIDAVAPLVDQFTDEFNRWLGDAYDGVKIKADYSTVPEMQEDRNELAQAYKIGVELGAYSPNEFREKMGDQPKEDPDMDQHYTNSGRTTLNQIASEGLFDNV
jgi:HK97 family phage portal protein